jgi:hypothetical protein
VSYQVAPASGAKLTLLNGWKTGQPCFQRLPAMLTGSPLPPGPSYSVHGGVVSLSGELCQPAGTNDEFAVLPKAARPAHILYIKIGAAAGEVAVLQISPNGRMAAWEADQLHRTRMGTSLAAVSYPLGS